MDLSSSPGKILLRLEELRKWQKIQEERLHQQQMIERQKLIAEQELLTESLSISSSCIGLEVSNEEVYTNIENISKDYSSVGNIISQTEVLKYEQNPIELNYSCSKVNNRADFENKPNHDVDYATEEKYEEVQINPAIENCNLFHESKTRNVNFTNDDEHIKPNATKPYLKRGEGLLRFNMRREDVGKGTKMPWLKKKKKKTNKASVTKVHDEDILTSKSKKKLTFKINQNTSPQDGVLEACGFEGNHELIQSENIPQYQKHILENKVCKEIINENFDDSIKLETLNNIQNLLEKKSAFDSSFMENLLLSQLSVEKEKAEQNMFELIEKKIDDNSFSSVNSIYTQVFNVSNNTYEENRQYVNTNPRLLKLHPTPSQFEFQRNKKAVNMNSDYENCTKENEKEEICRSNCVSDDNFSDHKSSESSDTEETCRMAIKDIPTSTPNIIKFEKQHENKATIDCGENKIGNKNRIKIVIKGNDSEKYGSFYLDEDSTLTPDDNHSSVENISKIENKGKLNDQEDFEKSDMPSKGEIFKKRLQELEAQIQIFHSENALLKQMKEEFSMEKEKFQNEKALIERQINEDRIIAEYHLAEEKEKLLKQKLLYDRNSKEMKLHNSKKDREEINKLNTELTHLREQIALKDSRNGSAQARLRNQIRILEEKNAELKDECEKLKKENRKIKNYNSRSQRLTNIKMLADISKSLTNNVNLEIDNEVPSSSKTASNELLTDLHSAKSAANKKNQKPKVSKQNMRLRTKSVPNLSATSKYTKFFSERDKEIKQKQNAEVGYGFESSDDSDHSIDANEYLSQLNKKDLVNKTPEATKLSSEYENHESNGDEVNIDSIYSPEFGIKNSDPVKTIQFDSLKKISMPNDSLKTCMKEQLIEKPNFPPQNYSNHTFDFNKLCLSEAPQSVTSHSTDRIENVKPDGSLEVKFSNGNLKIVTADGSYSKFTFYNGDVKETFYNDGLIKYYYNELKIYHTTYKDGTEVLLFPNGYIERRYKDGSLQAHLPNGVTRWMKPGSDEEWRFPDGTVVLASSNGDQTLRFPNGQIEIHTKEYRKRVFPDGTSRIVYADGVIETRYANGRIRVKDKQGNLVMDSTNRNCNFNS